MDRYFLDTDASGHWYVVPVSRQADWEAWCALPEEDEESWEAPGFAYRIGGSPTLVTFGEPQIEGKPVF